MEALGALAVAERDIRALSTARADRARSGDSPAARPRLALPVRQGRFLWNRLLAIHRRDGPVLLRL